MEGAGYYLILLFLCQFDEVHRIAAYADGKLRIFFGMCLGVEERFSCENVDVQVVTALLNVAVKERHEIIYLIFCCCHIDFSFLWSGVGIFSPRESDMDGGAVVIFSLRESDMQTSSA